MSDAICKNTEMSPPCDRAAAVRGYCKRCYTRTLAGIPMDRPPQRPNGAPLYFNMRITAGGCWEWQYATDRDGYGITHHNGKSARAHVVSWTLSNKADPLGKEVCHTCDNPPCINPDHLFLGTSLDNHIDQVRKERAGKSLTKDAVMAIRDEAARGVSRAVLAARYGVTQSTVGSVVRRETWRFVD